MGFDFIQNFAEALKVIGTSDPVRDDSEIEHRGREGIFDPSINEATALASNSHLPFNRREP